MCSPYYARKIDDKCNSSRTHTLTHICICTYACGGCIVWHQRTRIMCDLKKIEFFAVSTVGKTSLRMGEGTGTADEWRRRCRCGNACRDTVCVHAVRDGGGLTVERTHYVIMQFRRSLLMFSLSYESNSNCAPHVRNQKYWIHQALLVHHSAWRLLNAPIRANERMARAFDISCVADICLTSSIQFYLRETVRVRESGKQASSEH